MIAKIDTRRGLFPVSVSSQSMFLRTTHFHSLTAWTFHTQILGDLQPKGIFILFDCKASGREIRTRSLLPCQGAQ